MGHSTIEINATGRHI